MRSNYEKTNILNKKWRILDAIKSSFQNFNRALHKNWRLSLNNNKRFCSFLVLLNIFLSPLYIKARTNQTSSLDFVTENNFLHVEITANYFAELLGVKLNKQFLQQEFFEKISAVLKIKNDQIFRQAIKNTLFLNTNSPAKANSEDECNNKIEFIVKNIEVLKDTIRYLQSKKIKNHKKINGCFSVENIKEITKATLITAFALWLGKKLYNNWNYIKYLAIAGLAILVGEKIAKHFPKKSNVNGPCEGGDLSGGNQSQKKQKFENQEAAQREALDRRYQAKIDGLAINFFEDCETIQRKALNKDFSKIITDSFNHSKFLIDETLERQKIFSAQQQKNYAIKKDMLFEKEDVFRKKLIESHKKAFDEAAKNLLKIMEFYTHSQEQIIQYFEKAEQCLSGIKQNQQNIEQSIETIKDLLSNIEKIKAWPEKFSQVNIEKLDNSFTKIQQAILNIDKDLKKIKQENAAEKRQESFSNFVHGASLVSELFTSFYGIFWSSAKPDSTMHRQRSNAPQAQTAPTTQQPPLMPNSPPIIESVSRLEGFDRHSEELNGAGHSQRLKNFERLISGLKPN